MNPCGAFAEPSRFPDLSGYAPVNVIDYTITLPNPGRAPLNEVYFLTPDGITCDFSNPPAAGCTGNDLPGIAPPDKNPYTYVGTDTGIQPATSTPYANATIQDHQIRTLPPFHSITMDGVICGVDNSRMTACKDPQGRGFVLSPHGSAWLQHV
ncbi:hypothetical protein [Mycobacterium avium]|uniref:hypothetical protein n=1 Tax=Mycobacterium avium TaxID=1764 RepID=UPI00148253F6|nr:hypothetical protein [Mycobacterium avium]QBB84576.2 hypothetical protein BJP74_23575 [Mycobacterium avium subsp. hominissuis]QBB84745.2 hypothetical protein BEP52_23970 [Mycobacterium avium subsp. hominissuis]QBC16819.2 hypothetical protein BJP78_23695 [Mycobacterium avium subsp. hominissuis]QBZ39348.2 hypothetical protein KV38_26305 [Mycobacterium avium subsp. hominissuis]